jgi:hypothetical protein
LMSTTDSGITKPQRIIMRFVELKRFAMEPNLSSKQAVTTWLSNLYQSRIVTIVG